LSNPLKNINVRAFAALKFSVRGDDRSTGYDRYRKLCIYVPPTKSIFFFSWFWIRKIQSKSFSLLNYANLSWDYNVHVVIHHTRIFFFFSNWKATLTYSIHKWSKGLILPFVFPCSIKLSHFCRNWGIVLDWAAKYSTSKWTDWPRWYLKPRNVYVFIGQSVVNIYLWSVVQSESIEKFRNTNICQASHFLETCHIPWTLNLNYVQYIEELGNKRVCLYKPSL
jgi:hypothetical protein